MARLVLGNKLARAAKDRPWLHRVAWGFEASLVAVGLFIFRLLPVDRASALGRRLIGSLGPRLARNQKFKRVLRDALPTRSASEIDDLAAAIWGNAGAVMAEYPHLDRICRGEGRERLQIETRASIRALEQRDRPALFVTAHLSNFEVCAAAIRQSAGPVSVVYKSLKNPWLERRLAKYRQSMGCRLISSDQGPKPLLSELRAGRSVGIVMDQRHAGGTPIPFFGIPKPTTLVPARLALRCGVELVPVRAERLNGSRFRVTFYEPVPHGDPDEPEADRVVRMTTRINGLFEQWIRERPQDWLPMRPTKDKDSGS